MRSVLIYIVYIILELDGLILSPTREKLEPTIPKKTDENLKNISQKSSPKKDSSLRSSLKKNNQKPSTKTTIRTGENFDV